MTSIRILVGDSLERLAELPENSVDSVVCDPPYGLGKPPPIEDVLRAWLAGDEYQAKGGGMMGLKWDAFVPGPAVWRECLRVLKPGGHMLAFFGTRTEDVGSIAIRMAGFERRNLLAWMYGSGMPASKRITDAIAQHLKQEEPAEAEPWEGWATALAPALEPIVMARKPLAGTIGANVLEHGTAGLNLDACRNDRGNHPANLLHDGSQCVLDLFPTTAPKRPSPGEGELMDTKSRGNWGFRRQPCSLEDAGGSAARYFYCSKASSAERDAGLGGPVLIGGERAGGRAEGSAGLASPRAGTHTPGRCDHPTVKPVDLMRWMVRLVTPPGGTVLDPFMGSGSTGIAAHLEGFDFIGCELDPHHAATAELRIRHYSGKADIVSEAPGEEVKSREPDRVGFFV